MEIAVEKKKENNIGLFERGFSPKTSLEFSPFQLDMI